MEWTAVMAIYGAVVSTVTAAWNIRAGLRDRARLKVDLRLRKIVYDTTGRPLAVDADDLTGARLMLTVTNTGRRPITLSGWGGRFRRPRNGNPYFVILTRDMPKELRESEQYSESTDEFQSAFEAGVKAMYVTDSTGRRWPVPRKVLRAAIAEYAHLKKVQPAAEQPTAGERRGKRDSRSR